MSQYSEEELLSLTREEAEEELSDEQLKRYNSLKAQQLQDSVDDYKEEKAMESAEGLDKLLSDVKDEMTSEVEIAGNKIKILVDPDQHDVKTIQRARKLADKDEEDLNEEDIEEVKDSMFTLLGEITVDYSKEDWKTKFEEKGVGLYGLLNVMYPILETVEEEMEQKKRRSKNMR